MKKALSIAGSDSSAGAGIQADLKTFSALGIYGATVITTLTAQNTKTVSDIFVVPPKFFENQLRTTLTDIKPDVIKIGVLYDRSIIQIVKDELANCEKPIIVDPVLYSGTGIRLLDESSFEAFKQNILPLANVITPNLKEAELLSNTRVKSTNDLSKAARYICDLGAEIVIIKGGHYNRMNNEVSDFYYNFSRADYHKISNPRLPVTETHGTGCNFSSAIASYIAMGCEPKRAFILSNSYVNRALRNALKVGNGLLVANPISQIYNNSEKYETLITLQSSVENLEQLNYFSSLIPETKTNFVYSIPIPRDLFDVAGVVGRITNYQDKIRSPNVVKFGASNHVGRALLVANNFTPSIRSAINIKLTDRLLEICKELFKCSFYDRKYEHVDNAMKEGTTIQWGVKEAFKREPNLEVVFHYGDIGKEPMILIFAETPNGILTKIDEILRIFKKI
ncbi:bifunctional hydroxymethylpyrimidine kinase/phosphomethylpyrimidine kinase [Candidatus Nitrosocosmicus franklandus]|uniref:Hydroxymethylpyrimidine/phosphomethylpyrimidine kinase n=1 Tax=Candidatus Nitrosocosmicus franklandianus TaxID=1798806 RepID=A0A484I8V6_9ARCH|nr:bifunctional hydroxymethylpyrimidine kinase/phosphomethylpyrimidine kinase [Candidatus Nitrosocosmicus franklandus]VFJ12422.1 Hydroxymethylpyrimidine/phosphomethylpyrimidine kinase [Candidatus Nitrosocosmicus franklandus]